MKRRCFRKPVVALSLFPFLAVLVCTMGALILLLVMVLHNARTDSAAAAELSPGPIDPDRMANLQLEKEDEEWRRSELERQRTEYQQQLVQQRLTLSHFEDHIRRLEEQWQALSSQAAALQQLDSQQADNSEASAAHLAEIRTTLEQKRAELEEARRQLANRQPAFAIVPYDGPNGTKRRPIYVECTDQGIVLQPEGVLLTPADFEGSLGPGNPLDAALRMVREYLARYRSADGQAAGEPYPLLVVRPNGTVAYAVARAAIKSWDDEFGYELVDADLQLAYPQPDLTLKRELERAIQDARQRQAALAAIMPGRYRTSSPGLVATTNGGFASLGGAVAGPAASSATGFATGGTAPDTPGTALGTGSSFTKTFREGASDQAASDMSLDASQRSAALAGASGNAMFSTRSGSNPADGGAAFSPTGGQLAAGGQTGSAANSPAGTESQVSSAPGESSGPSGSAGTPSTESAGRPGQPTSKSSLPLANARGANWGLPANSANATGIQRYIQVECLPDRLLLLYDRGDHRTPTTIPMPGETRAAVDPLVTAIWTRTDQWGIAGEGCYWKPVIRIAVRPGAEQRYADLASLLTGSGLVVERKDAR